MRILISNDDGIHAPGLKVLEKMACALSSDVWVVAPELDQSGSGHSLTLRNPLRVREVSDQKFAVSGTPTDCVMMAIQKLLDTPPDLVLSGINHGANLAEDVTYSGTVAAAMEASLLGLPAVAISLTVPYHTPAKWSTVEHYLPDILTKLIQCSDQTFKPKGSKRTLININIPNIATHSVKGLRLTHQGHRRIDGKIEERLDPRGRKYYWIGTIDYDGRGDEGTDLEAITDGFISLTPLSLDLTHQQTLRELHHVFS